MIADRDLCPGTWGGHRCRRPFGHDGACHADGVAWMLGRDIVLNLDGPPSATSQGYGRWAS